MLPAITYGKLYDKLRKLGFHQRSLEMNDKRWYVFEHKQPGEKNALSPSADSIHF